MRAGGPGGMQISWAMKFAGDFLGDFTYNRPAHVTGHRYGGTSIQVHLVFEGVREAINLLCAAKLRVMFILEQVIWVY